MSEGGKRSAWIKHVMSVKKPGMSLGDAMKVAKKTWKKTSKTAKRGGMLGPQSATGGVRGTRKMKKGGVLYGFTGGPYANSELTDGAGRFPPYNLNDNQWQGANPAAMSGGRKKHSRKSRKSRQSRRR